MYGQIKGFVFEETKSLSDCLTCAEKDVKRTLKIFGSFPQGETNEATVRNRIVERAALNYVSSNFYRLDFVSDLNRALHFGVPLGTTRKVNFSGGYFQLSNSTQLVKDLRDKVKHLDLKWWKND